MVYFHETWPNFDGGYWVAYTCEDTEGWQEDLCLTLVGLTYVDFTP